MTGEGLGHTVAQRFWRHWGQPERRIHRGGAEAADVSEPTVFNYFPTKESLVFNEDRERELALLQAVRDRPPGTSVVVAFRDKALELLDRHRRETYMDWE